MRKLFHFILMTTLLPLSFAACSSDDNIKDEHEELVNLLPETRSVQLSAEQKKLVETNNDFAFKFFNQVYASAVQDNQAQSIASSPLGVAYMLGMLNAGAEGNTKSEILNFLGFDGVADNDVNAYFSALLKQLPEADKNVTLLTANALYLNKNYSFSDAYLQTMKRDFEAQLETVDFSNEQDVLKRINGWANNKTKGMIPAIMDKVEPLTVACLLNSIYFKGNWASRFDVKRTANESFNIAPGKGVTVPMMHNYVAIKAAQNDDYAMVNIPFGNGLAWHMYVLLPNDTKTVADVLRGLNNESWKKMLQSQKTMEMDLKIPRFTTSSSLDLKPILQNCGIKEVFTKKSKLSKIVKSEIPLFISKMDQNVKFGVDEDGVKMATITKAEMEFTSAYLLHNDKGKFYADSPFVYIISEASSGVILSMGVYQGK